MPVPVHQRAPRSNKLNGGRRAVVEPIFLLSVPRAGSTLLQRVLGSHAEIATASEPWFLLPLLYSLRERGVNAEYEHAISARGVNGFAREYLPAGEASYLAAIREFALGLYAQAAPGKTYFLDKTPRYHHIAPELLRVFPDARFIFLWRHPLAVAASCMQTWSGGNWNLDEFSADLFAGVKNLVELYANEHERGVSLRYEDLLQRPGAEVARLCDYLELPFDPSVLDRFSELPMRNPRFWDPNATRYRTITTEPLAKWKTTMCNPLRKAWCRRYLRSLGAERLALMGYELDAILAELDAIPTRADHLGGDLKQAARGVRSRRARARLLDTPLPLWRTN